MKKLTIITSCNNMPEVKHGEVAILAEYAIDSSIAKRYPKAISIEKLIGNADNTYTIACDLVKQILLNEPEFRGVPQLSVFIEQLNWELHKIIRLIHLHEFLMNENFKICEFTSASWWSHSLTQLVNIAQSNLSVQSPSVPKQNQIKNSVNRILAGHFSVSSILDEIKNLFDKMDPYHKRSFIGKRNRLDLEKNQIWYYSTAVTFTNIALFYEPYLPDKLNYLVENSTTGGKPLRKRNIPFHTIYQFSRNEFIPGIKEITTAKNTIENHILQSHLSHASEIVKKLLLNSAWLTLFFNRYLPKGLYSSSVFENWLASVNPSALWVGNFVFEGYALYKAKAAKVPTTLLQHGILGGCYQYNDYPVDWYVMRGEFWKESLSPSAQKRTMIINPTYDKNKQQKSNKDTIIYITTPFHVRYMPVDIDAESILCTLLETIKKTNTQLLIRVHPLERIVDYQNLANKLCHQLNCNINISYSQHDDLDTLLPTAAAVVLQTSTVFLDCIKHEVPVISFDWCEFWYKQRIRKHNIFYFSKNLAELSNHIRAAAQGQLVCRMENAEFVLENTQIENIQQRIPSLFTQNERQLA